MVETCVAFRHLTNNYLSVICPSERDDNLRSLAKKPRFGQHNLPKTVFTSCKGKAILLESARTKFPPAEKSYRCYRVMLLLHDHDIASIDVIGTKFRVYCQAQDKNISKQHNLRVEVYVQVKRIIMVTIYVQ